MLLREMFSAIGAPTEEDEKVDWLGDLKYYIDNNDEVLSNFFFPAIKKHQEWHGHPDAYKLYIKPLEHCKNVYCDEFDIEDGHEKFPKEELIKLAKQIASEQHKHIEDGDYKE